MTKQMSFVEAMRDYFGLQPGQTLTSFFQELKHLSPEEREYFKQGLKQFGYELIVKI